MQRNCRIEATKCSISLGVVGRRMGGVRSARSTMSRQLDEVLRCSTKWLVDPAILVGGEVLPWQMVTPGWPDGGDAQRSPRSREAMSSSTSGGL